MDASQTVAAETRAPQEWAVACLAEAARETNPEAKAAFQQLAEEFQFLAEEIEGLVSTFEVLAH